MHVRWIYFTVLKRFAKTTQKIPPDSRYIDNTFKCSTLHHAMRQGAADGTERGGWAHQAVSTEANNIRRGKSYSRVSVAGVRNT